MTKVKIKERCKSILQEKYNIDDVVSGEEDKAFLMSVFSQHPEYQKKVGCGYDIF